MRKHHGGNGRSKKFFAYADKHGDWEQPSSGHGGAKVRRARHKPYDRYSRSNRIGWLEDLDRETY
jgi:hypothetical protein